MVLSGLKQSFLISYLTTSWYSIPAAYQRLFMFVAFAALPLWLTITSFDVKGYVVGAEQILAGQSVYGPQVRSPFTGRVVPRYPYLPSWAIFLAIGIAPFSVLAEIGIVPEFAYQAVARQIANAPGYLALVGTPVLAYHVCSDFVITEGSDGNISDDWVFWGVLLMTLTPALWFQVLESGSDTFVALLSLLGVWAVMNKKWITAGVFVGLATFKFTAVPMAAVLSLYALSHGRDQFGAVAIGGAGSQLPNVLYFILFPDDFLYVLEQHGSMSLYSGETRAVATAPIRLAGLEQWYVDIGFVFAFVLFVGIGAYVALRRQNLILGFAIAYLSTSYFAPVGEVNPSVLIVLLLFEAAVNFRRRQVRYIAAGLLAVQFYGFVFPLHNIGHISAVPFPWWSAAIRVIEFGMMSIALVGLVYFTDHNLFQTD